MSDQWYRFGIQPSGRWIDTVPSYPESVLYVSYRVGNREDVAYTYDKGSAVFTAVNTSNISITVESDLFELEIDSTVAMSVSGGVFSVNKLSEKWSGSEPSAVFRRKTGAGTIKLATLTKSGVFTVPKILEHSTFPGTTDLFAFKNSAAITAVLSNNGLQADSFLEGIV